MKRKRTEKPREVQTEGLRGEFKVQLEAGTPELIRTLFAREPGVTPTDEYTYQLKFSVGAVRPHARHLQLELSAIISEIPWVYGRQMIVSYGMYYLIRGSTPKSATEAIVLDLARRVGPGALFPFIRETVQSITARAGSSIMLPMMDWSTAFPPDLEIPAPQGETPPEFLEPV